MRASRHALALACVLGLAAVLRFTSLGFDLDTEDPDRTLIHNHVDARAMVYDLLRALESGELDPGSFLYRGPAGFLVFGAADALFVGLRAAVHPQGRAGVLADLEVNPAPLALIHRWVSALAGVLTVLAVARCAGREFGAAVGLCASLVLAVSYLHVRDSHLGTVDVLGGLALVLALDACFRLAAAPRATAYVRAGLLAGVAVATKYFNAVLGLHLLLAHSAARSRARAAGLAPPGHGRLVVMLALVPAAFLLLFPGFFTGAADDFGSGIGWGVESLSPRGDGLSQLRLLHFHLTQTFAIGLGEPVLLAACAGLVLAWRRGANGRFLVAATLLLVPMLVLTTGTVVRYGMGVLVALALPAGLALATVPRVRPALGAVVLAAVLAPSLVRSVALLRLWRQSDTRLLALTELRECCGSGERVVAVGFVNERPLPQRPYAFQLVHLRPGRGSVRAEDVLAGPPRWLLVNTLVPLTSAPRGAELDELTRTRYRTARVLGDPTDAPLLRGEGGVPTGLRIPYARPWAVERPGPPMILYERVD